MTIFFSGLVQRFSSECLPFRPNAYLSGRRSACQPARRQPATDSGRQTGTKAKENLMSPKKPPTGIQTPFCGKWAFFNFNNPG
jgi:hypothetical protein